MRLKSDLESRYFQFLVIFLIVVLPLCLLAETWQFVVYGDTRSQDNRHREVLQAIKSNTPDYRFIINVGDVVGYGPDTTGWFTWQNACYAKLGDLGQDSLPPMYMAAPGNHDKVTTSSGLENWNRFLPGQVRYGNNGEFFVFDYENARFIVLNSNRDPIFEPQYSMLLDTITNNPRTWLFTIWHHPIFDFGEKHYEDDIHDFWGVPLYEHGCDIMFMGHAHYYVRTKKMRLTGEKNPPVDSLYGTVQVVTGNSGAPIDIPDPSHDGNGYMVEEYSRNSSHYGYTEITVNEDSLRLRHFLKDGTLFDEAFYTPNPKTVSSISREDCAPSPDSYYLAQNYPNPFNSRTVVRYGISEAGFATIVIYNLLANPVCKLVGKYHKKGEYVITWDGKDSNGMQLPGGIYFYRLKSKHFSSAKKLIYIP